jgi:hypothetical protein
MQIPLSKIKILKTEFENQLKTEELISLLLSGRLYEFEQILHQLLIDLYNKISEELIKWISLTPTFVTAQKNKASEKGLKKLDFRKAQIQLRTGKKINYDSLYAKSAPTDYEGSRHLSLLIFQSEESTSPMYKSLSCLHSVLCPSFQVAKELMNYQGIKVNFDRVRQNSLALADVGMKKRSSVQLEQGESLSRKALLPRPERGGGGDRRDDRGGDRRDDRRRDDRRN